VKNVLINPTIPILPGATEVHGISDEDVKDKAKFNNSDLPKETAEIDAFC